MNVQLFTRQALFTELKNLYSFSRYFDSKFRKYKGLTIGSELKIRFSARSRKMYQLHKKLSQEADFWPECVKVCCKKSYRSDFSYIENFQNGGHFQVKNYNFSINFHKNRDFSPKNGRHFGNSQNIKNRFCNFFCNILLHILAKNQPPSSIS